MLNLIILEMSDQSAERLLKYPKHKKWLDKLGVFELQFQNLDDESLSEILVDVLEHEGGLEIPEESQPKLVRLVKDEKEATADDFKGAHTMRRLGEDIINTFVREEREDKKLDAAFLDKFISAR